MNKAFVKESEDPGDRCPVCGATGVAVYQTTLQAHLPAESAARFADAAFFCPQATCAAAYFDEFEQFVPVTSLLKPVYPKDPDAPICACFGFSCGDIEADIDEGVVTRVKAQLARAESAEARCSTNAADGRSCVAAVQSYFMRLRNG